MDNKFVKLLLLVLTFLLVVIYLQNVSLKKEIKDLRNRINGMRTFEKGEISSPKKPLEEKVIYIGNSNSLKFHLSDCQWARKVNPTNKVYFTSKEEALRKGYQPCKVCNP